MYKRWKASNTEAKQKALKGLFHPKMKILSVFTHPHVVTAL